MTRVLTRPAGGDVVAAFSVALVLIPQSLAYAAIAGVDPVYGLYAAVAAPIAGAFIGSSPYLQTGPVAMTSLLTFGALAPLAEPETVEFAGLAAVLALVVGLVRLGIGLVGAGPVAYLMSQPVVVSFTTAGAILIISTQVPGAGRRRLRWRQPDPGCGPGAVRPRRVVGDLCVTGSRGCRRAPGRTTGLGALPGGAARGGRRHRVQPPCRLPGLGRRGRRRRDAQPDRGGVRPGAAPSFCRAS